MIVIKKLLQRLTVTQTILLGYLFIVILGGILLTLPISSYEGTNFLDALFTATSATCVTGLIRFDTYTHWTLFGQLVILALIQIGGIGFMTVAIQLTMITGRKIGLHERVLMSESVSAPSLGGIVRMSKFIFLGTLLVEGIGALLLSFHFIPDFGLLRGIYFSIFHSISAFCNAGFDLMGINAPFSSLTAYSGNTYVNIIIMALIVIGGLGFFVWHDLLKNKFKFKNLQVHSKIVLVMTLVLIFGGAACIFLIEQGSALFVDAGLKDQLLYSAFQSVTSRTAGFNTADFASMREASILVMVLLMLAGGSPGSTAGGMKTTTVAMMYLNVKAKLHSRKSIECFGRRIDDDTLHTSAIIFMLYLTLFFSSTLIISAVEDLPILTVMFETSSAVATVGLTMGITPTLGVLSEIILTCLMLFGRVGSITFLVAFASEHSLVTSKLPLDKIRVG